MFKISNYCRILTVAVAAFLPISFIHSTSGSGSPAQTCGAIAAGKDINAQQTVNCGNIKTEGGKFNAAGDKVNWSDVSKEKKNAEKWGSITSIKSHTLKFPKSGEKKIITLTPKAGRLNDKEVDILLVSFDKRDTDKPDQMPNVPATVRAQFKKVHDSTEFNSMIKIYRKTATEREWTELYELFSDQSPNSRNLDVKITISPEGKIKTAQSVEFTDEDLQKHTVPPFEIDLAGFE